MTRTIHGSGKNLRTFLFVSDIVEAFDLILHKGITGELYNIAGKSEISGSCTTTGINAASF